MAAEAGSQKNSDSGKVYDFKDSKTSGVVTVTKTWDDSSSNDERPVPDVSISTEKPSKNPLGYTITYHGNGLAFADGTTENQIIVNSSGKIISGQYKELLTSSGWYSDSNCTTKIETDSNGLPVSGVTSDMELYAKSKTFVLKEVRLFDIIPDSTTEIVFTDEAAPNSEALINDLDEDGDGGIVAWSEGTKIIISTQCRGKKIIATSCEYLFTNKNTKSHYKLTSVDLKNLDTSSVTSMEGMFARCGFTYLDLSPLDTNQVTTMHCMFYECSDLSEINLSSLRTDNVTTMHGMFGYCVELSKVDVSHFNTSKVTNMHYMFCACSALKDLDLSSFDTCNVTDMIGMFGITNLDTIKTGSKFAFVGPYYALPEGTWYASDSTAYTSDGNSCTIPNNKADTYTRR